MNTVEKTPSAAQRMICFRNGISSKSRTVIKGTECEDKMSLEDGSKEPSHKQNLDGATEVLDGWLGATSADGNASSVGRGSPSFCRGFDKCRQ